MKSTLDETLDVIANIDKSETPAEICEGLTQFTGQFGLTSMLAGAIPQPRLDPKKQAQHLFVSAFPQDWMQRYLERNYVYVDPVIRRIQSDISPFEWADTKKYHDKNDPRASRMVFNEAKEFKLNSGFAIPMIALDGSILAVSLAGEKVELPPNAPGMIAMVSTFAIGRAIELRSRHESATKVRLTAREVECLKWAAEGKTEWEISIILGISEHTADKHLSNAHRKLCAATRTQAVARAFRLGIIS